MFQFLILKFEDDTDQNYDLNIKEYGLYKNLRKKVTMIIKRKKNFLPYYNKATPTVSDENNTFTLALFHCISSGSDNSPTFEQFVLHQQKIEKNNVVYNYNSESSTDTKTIVDLSLVNKFKKKSKKVLCYISDMSNSNSEYNSTGSDDSVSILNNMKQKVNIKGNDY